MKLYNSLTKQKEDFVPLHDKEVKIYVCGITPYDTTHLGHAFTYVSYDTLIRYLLYKKYKVIYVQNVTDIDDDILKKAKETGTGWIALGEFWTGQFLSDMKALNVLPPTYYVKATESIDKIIDIIRNLITKGFAYSIDGNVYFQVDKNPSYGGLSKFTTDQMNMLSRERGGNPDDPNKKNPLDFLLWQKSKKNDPFWESPWGKGRPGWHIECSAMIHKYLGDQIDIHGGGRDLIYPHHESEIIQSENFTGKKPFVKYWLHTAMVMYQGEKMSKSLGNLVMVSDLLKKYSPDTIRHTLLLHHYRTPWEFDEGELMLSREILRIVNQALQTDAGTRENADTKEDFLKKFETFMDDDLNTPRTLRLIQYIAQRILDKKTNENISSSKNDLKTILSVLGLSVIS